MNHAALRNFSCLIAGLLMACAAGAQQLNFTPFHANGIYALGDKVGWTVAPAPGTKPTTTFSYTVKTNQTVVIGSGSFDLSSGSATITVPADQPAMVQVYVDAAGAPPPGQPSPAEADQVNDNLKALLAKSDPALRTILDKYPSYCLIGAPCGTEAPDLGPSPPRELHLAVLGAAVDPTGLQPTAPRPADFDAFWAAKLAALKKVPINPVLTSLPTAQPGVKLYMVQLDSLGSHVHGYLALPSGKGPFPAMIIYQWAGVYKLQTEWATNRAAEGWLVFDVDSHDVTPDQTGGVPKDYYEVGNTSRETSYFLNMYLRDTRALDFVTTLPHWNKKTVVFTGTSMGGQQSLVTAALNPGRVSAVVVNVPSGADSNAELHGRKAAYPNWAVSDPRVAETALYFDTVNFAPRIKAPTMIAVGFIDTIACPAGDWTAFDRIAGPKEIVPMPESDHNNYTPDKEGAFFQRSEEVLATLLHGGRFNPNPAASLPQP